MAIRNRQNPRQKRQVYLSAEVAAQIDAAALEAGLSIGQFLDRVWLERATPSGGSVPPKRPASKEPTPPPPAAGTNREHSWKFSDMLKAWLCEVCGKPKNSGGTPRWCQGPPK